MKQFCWPRCTDWLVPSCLQTRVYRTTQSKVRMPYTMPHVSISPCTPTLPHAVRFVKVEWRQLGTSHRCGPYTVNTFLACSLSEVQWWRNLAEILSAPVITWCLGWSFHSGNASNVFLVHYGREYWKCRNYWSLWGRKSLSKISIFKIFSVNISKSSGLKLWFCNGFVWLHFQISLV